MKIIPLSEGSFTVDKTKMFVPFNKQTDVLRDRAPGSLLVEIQPFVIITNKDIILLDTGLGFSSEDGVSQLFQNLKSNGIDPAAVTKVLMSHLHKDHTGGIQDSLSAVLNFPEAKYYVNDKELAAATEKETSSYQPSAFSSLLNSSNLIQLDDEGMIDGYIHYEMCGGHSPYHVAYTIEEEHQIIFYGGDVAPQLQQMKNRFVAKYDYDGKKSMELRKKWWEEGKEQHWTFCFYHDIKCPVMSF